MSSLANSFYIFVKVNLELNYNANLLTGIVHHLTVCGCFKQVLKKIKNHLTLSVLHSHMSHAIKFMGQIHSCKVFNQQLLIYKSFKKKKKDEKAKLLLKNFRYEQLSRPPPPFLLELSLTPTTTTKGKTRKEKERKERSVFYIIFLKERDKNRVYVTLQLPVTSA